VQDQRRAYTTAEAQSLESNLPPRECVGTQHKSRVTKERPFKLQTDTIIEAASRVPTRNTKTEKTGVHATEPKIRTNYMGLLVELQILGML